jgi:hypothetical protein
MVTSLPVFLLLLLLLLYPFAAAADSRVENGDGGGRSATEAED